MKAFKKVTNKIRNSKIIKNPVFLVIGLIAIILVIALLYFIFLKYSPIMNFKYEGYAISGKEITENLLGSGETDNTNANKNIELTKIEEQGTIFKKLNDYFVGSKEKTEINLNYPIYINGNSSLYNLSEGSTLISKDFEEVSGYPNLSISEGKIYDGNNLERADAKEYIFVKTTDNIYINLYEIKVKTTANEYTIPVNSLIAFTENSIRYYSVNSNVLVFNQINDVDNNSNVQIVENSYTYKELLTKLGILQEESNNTESSNSQENIIEENTANGEVTDDNENNDNEQPNTDNNTTDQNGYIKPEVTADNFTAEVYTAKSTLHIKDPSGRIIEAPTFEIYKDGKIYLRRTFSNSGEIQITGLVPDTEYEVIGKYIYLNENNQKVENTFYEGKFTTKGYEELGSIDIQKENGEIFSNKIQLTKVKITSDLNAEVLKGVNQVEIETGEIRTVLKNGQVNELLQGKEITIESSEGLKSDSKINYVIKFYDNNGVELKVNNNEGEARTSKEEPTVRVNIKEQDIVSVTLGLKLTNKDNVELENYKYVVTRPNGEVVQEKKLSENETELLLEDLDQNQYYKISIYADYDLNDNRGKQEQVEIGNLVFATQPISTLGSLELTVENKELTSTTSTINYKIDEERTDKRLIQILNELTINIVEQPEGYGDNNNQETREGTIVYTDTLTGDEITNLQQAGTKEIKYENLKSNTTYTIEITGNVQLGNTQEKIQITYNYKEFTTLKIPAKVEIRNQFVTGNLIDFDVRIEDINNAVLNNTVRMELRNSSNDLIDLQELTTNEDYIRKTYEKLEENQTYRLSFYADQYNEGKTDETYKVNYLLKEIEIVTEPGISGSIGLTELSRKATGKNLVDMSSETKWYVYPNFNTNDYYGKEYNAETKTLTLGGHGNYRRVVYDLREYAGQEVTMSFKAKQVDDSYVETYIQNSKTNVNRTQIQGLTTEWKDFQYTITVDSTGYLGFYIVGGNGIEIKELQIELGNKKTSYEEFKYTLQSDYSVNLEDRRDEITTNDYYIKIYEDNNLVKEDRYEEIPEENVITNAIKAYETETNKQYKVELVVKLRDREYVLSELEYNTQDTEEIKGIYNKEDFLEIQPRGHYIVLGDIDLSDGTGGQYQFGNGNFMFEGTINFNGNKLLINNGLLDVFHTIGKNGNIQNLVLERIYNYTNFYSYGLSFYNYGTISNVQVNIYSDENYIGYRGYSKTILAYNNYGTIDKFIINFVDEINIEKDFGTVSYNYGTMKNGYICGEKINSNYELETALNKDIGALCYRNQDNGIVKNIYTTIDVELAEGNYVKNATPLVAYSFNSATSQNIYSTGNIINCDANNGINIWQTRGSGFTIENSYYMSDNTSTVTYDKKTTKLALYDVEFQNKILNEENCFEVENNIEGGYYPHLKLNDCMPQQEYIPLPEVADKDLADIIDSEILEQSSSTAKVKFKVNNPSAETITNIEIQNLSCRILEQEYKEGQSTVIAELYDPIICVSNYSVISISTKGAFNKEYTRTFQNNERILQLDMYREIRTVDEWNNINKSLTENYILMNDIDFINNGDKVQIQGTFSGKIKGNMYSLKNIQLQKSGIFATISEYGKIQDLKIDNYQAIGSSVYGIASISKGEINNVHMSNITIEKTNDSLSVNDTSAFVNNNYGRIYNSSVTNLEIKNNTLSSETVAGSMVSRAYGGTIENCFARNINVDITNNLSYIGIGGLVGQVQNYDTQIRNCYVTGNIKTDTEVGGIVGYLQYGDISNCYANINIETENSNAGGIVGNAENQTEVRNTLFLGNIYINGSTRDVSPICPNKDFSNNYVYEGVRLDGFLVDNSNNILSLNELKEKNTYLNTIGLGTQFCYDDISNEELPLLYKQGTTELLPNQEKIFIQVNGDIYIEEINAEKASVNEMQAVITINNPAEKQINNIDIYNMKIISKNIITRDGKTYITLTTQPTEYYSSYKVDNITYVENDETYDINTDAKIEIKFYKELYNVSDWQSIEEGSYQNYMLMNDIDFNNMENIKYNVTMQEFVTSNNTNYALKNIKLKLNEDNSGLIRRVTELENVIFENVSIENTTKNSKIGVIVSVGDRNKSTFKNIEIKADLSNYVGCITVSNGELKDITLDTVKIKGNDYIGALIPTTVNLVQNITVKHIEIEGHDRVGGLVGQPQNNIQNVNMLEDINVKGNNYVGGIAGSTNASNGCVLNCSIEDATVTGKSIIGGVVGQGQVRLVNIKNSNISGNNYVGGVAGILSNVNDNGCEVDTVNVNAIYDYSGGIAGQNNDVNMVQHKVTNSIVKGRNYVGGICGYDNVKSQGSISSSMVENSNIEANGDYVGGIVGSVEVITYSNYSVNSTVSGKNKVGGIIGEIAQQDAYRNYTNNSVVGEENVGGLIGYLDNERMTDSVYIIKIYENYVADSNITGNQNIGGLIGNSYKELLDNNYYYKNYVQADLISDDNLTVSLGIGGRKVDNQKFVNTYFYKYSTINGENPNEQNELFITQDKYLIGEELRNQTTYTSKLKWASYWNFSVLADDKYPTIKDNNFSNQEGIYLPIDADHIVNRNNIQIESISEDLTDSEQVEQTFEYDNKTIQTYSTYSMIGSSDGSQVTRSAKLYVKDNNLYAIPSVLNSEVSEGLEIVPVANNLILDNYNGKEYETVLGSDGKMYDLKEPIKYPENFINSDIESIGNNLNSDTKEIEVTYKNGDKIKFNYQTGEIISSSESDTSAGVGLFDYLVEKISEIGSSSSDVSQEIITKYEESKELQTKLEETSVEEAIEQQSNSTQAENGVTTTENIETNNSLEENKYISMYNEETGEYEIYNEEELLDTNKEEVVSENEKIEANNLGEYYASEGETKNTKMGIVWIVISIIGVGIILIILKKNLKKKA